ncbi:tetratricopeptide repeat protein [Chthonobacter albigriseus]|uniref:tetratricopeptide repeat protein n=1 Tax=Chthonobacter albigriseus TaxID=1683161 RepID=UPI0015EE6D6C|nr:tetratricopeptide repeat protein [Chthonobacter albigriseus]
MADIFDEVGEDLRRDQLNRFWRKHGATVIAVAVLIVVGTAGWRGYEAWQKSAAETAAGHYQAALDKAKAGEHQPASDDLLAFASAAPGGYKTLARFRAATEKAAAGDAAGALKDFQLIADDTAVAVELRDLARIRAAYLAVDTEDHAAIKARIEAIAVETNPWRHAAREILALSALRAGNYDEARPLVDKLVDDATVPQDVRSRAQILQGVIIAEKGQPAAAPATGS